MSEPRVRHFSMIRDFALADLITLANGFAGTGAILAALQYMDTRDRRISIALEAEALFERKVSWGVRCGERTAMFTHLATPVMTRLRQRERLVLDTLVAGGVARSRSDALAWCVRLVGQHTGDWLDQLRTALQDVERIRSQGPEAG